jgi:3-hydroxyisobutyrate dehydrogenase-like beta-hydroxyacid dehydrogenase
MHGFQKYAQSFHLKKSRHLSMLAYQGKSAMAQTNTVHIAFIGFGEVGQTFARDLLTRPDTDVAAHDILIARTTIEPDRGARLTERAAALGVRLEREAAQAVRGASVVISAVTASEAEAVAASAALYLQPGQIFLDVNSAAPTTKQRAAKHVEAVGAHYVEGAVMAPVLKPGLAVPILAGGPHAEATALIMNALGMNLTPVAKEHGRASAMKLCRSIMIKGLEALMVDCATASEKWDVKEPVFASLAETFPSIDWHALSLNMRERVATHGVRRAAEMREAGDMLAALELEPALAYAVADAQLRGASKRTGP